MVMDVVGNSLSSECSKLYTLIGLCGVYFPTSMYRLFIYELGFLSVHNITLYSLQQAA